MSVAAPGRALDGTLLALLAAAGYAALPVVVTLVARDGFPRDALLAQRFLVAGALLLALRRPWVPAGGAGPRVPWRRAAAALALGCGLYAGQTWLFFTAVERCGAGLAAVLLYLYPGFVTLLGWAFLGERPSGRRSLALALGCCGAALACAAAPMRPDFFGVAASLGGSALYAVYLLAGGRALRELSPLDAAAWVCSGAGLGFVLIAVGRGTWRPADSPALWAWVAALAVVGTIVPVSATFAAIRRVGVARTAILSTVEPLLTVGLATLVLGERPGALQLVGALALGSSVVLTHLDARA